MNKYEAAEMIKNDMRLHHDYLSGTYRKALNIAVKVLETEVIPIEWMKQKYPAAVNHDSVRYISKVDLLNEIIEEWRKEK